MVTILYPHKNTVCQQSKPPKISAVAGSNLLYYTANQKNALGGEIDADHKNCGFIALYYTNFSVHCSARGSSYIRDTERIKIRIANVFCGSGHTEKTGAGG